MVLGRKSAAFREACLVVAKECYGLKGLWAYAAFDLINERYFGGRLPYPCIVWGLTPHGGCVAWASTSHDRSRSPVITLHPSLLKGSEKADPWGIDPRWLGPSLAFDTLLHECIHIHVNRNLSGRDGPTSHNCRRWIRQVNRIAPLLGFRGINVGSSRAARVPVEPPIYTRRGKRVTRVTRVCTGNVPFAVGAGFPQSLRVYLGQAADHYMNQSLPDGLANAAGPWSDVN